MACSPVSVRSVTGPSNGVPVGHAGDRRRNAGREIEERVPAPGLDAELSVRDRVAVRVMGRIPELRIDPCFELLRQRVLEELGFRVHVGQREAETIDEIPLEESVVAKHLEGTPFARLGQLDSSIGSPLHEPELC
jgi:hypothetical protein